MKSIFQRNRILREAAGFFRAVHTYRPLWRRRVPGYQSPLIGGLVLELDRELVLHVRCPKTGREVCRSLSGQLDVIDLRS